MSEETKERVVKVTTLWSAEEIPEPDNLGEGEGYIIKMWYGEFRRGLLMMSGPEGFFIPATRSGVMDAEELCVLAEDMGVELDEKTLDSDEVQEYTTAIAYFRGKLNGNAIIFSYETEDDDHDELLAELADKFRKQGLSVM
mgnify:CR=1 FL=1